MSNLDLYLAPTMAEIRLKLTKSENADTGHPGTVSWLITGINLEDLQYVIGCNGSIA